MNIFEQIMKMTDDGEYPSFTHDYNGGAHGYYKERLLSFDHVRKQEIDFNCLFKDGSMEDILVLLKKESYSLFSHTRFVVLLRGLFILSSHTNVLDHICQTRLNGVWVRTESDR